MAAAEGVKGKKEETGWFDQVINDYETTRDALLTDPLILAKNLREREIALNRGECVLRGVFDNMLVAPGTGPLGAA